MQKFSRVVIAFAMLLGMVAMVPGVQATTYDPTNMNPPIKEGLVRLNQGGLGDALLGAFYRATVDGDFGGTADLDATNFLTYVSIENTSDDWVAAHIRLRSGRYSIEIIDFPVLLSPHDVFWFQFQTVVSNGVLTGVQIFSEDTKTLKYSDLPVGTDPNFPNRWTANIKPDLLKKFTTVVDAGQATVEEMAIGHMEVFGLWRLKARNADGITLASVLGDNNFTTLQSLFYSIGYFQPNYENSDPFYPQDCLNVLSGRVFSGDFTNGLYLGYTMDALANFRTNCESVRHRDEAAVRPKFVGGGDSGAIIYIPKKVLEASNSKDAAYSDPDWATTFGPTWNDGDDWTQGGENLSDSWSLDEVDDALAKQKVSSTYFNSGFTGQTFTLAVVTFPTKYLHVFFDKSSGIPEVWSTWKWPVAAQNVNQLRALLNVPDYAGEVTISGRIFDLEELPPGTNISPTVNANLKSEVNVIPIGNQSYNVLKSFANITFEESLFNVNGAPKVGFYAGWFDLTGFAMSQFGEDPRNGRNGYDRDDLPLLNCLREKAGARYLIPATVLTMDWEFFKNIPHSRAFAPSFTNPNNCPDEPVFPLFCIPVDGNTGL